MLYRDGQADRLTADPFLATGTMPPLSSTFNDTSLTRGKMPIFDPALCTGCGSCAVVCPTGAASVLHFDDQEVLAMVDAAFGE